MELPQLEIHNATNDNLRNLGQQHDGTVVIFTDKKALASIVPSAQAYIDLDASFGDAVQLLVPENKVPSDRVIIAPTGSLRNDFDDARRFRGRNRRRDQERKKQV